MIDISVDVYNIVRKAIKKLCKSTGVLDTDLPPSFPYVVVEQLGNAVYQRMSTSENPEEATSTTFQIKVYTKGDDSLADSFDIQSLASDAMVKMGFVRYYGFTAQKNVLDTSVLCYIARFRGIVDTEGKIYNS